jgi:site-specific recombinase XerD
MAKSLTDTLDTQVREGHISQSEANIISSFIFEIQAQRGSSDTGMMTRAWSLVRVAVVLHTFNAKLDNLDTDEVLRLVTILRGNGFSKNYLNDQIKTFKRFLIWRIENGVTTLNEKKIRAIKSPGMDWSTKKPTDMLSKEEVLQAITACTNSRDRAIISMLYDGSLRPVDLRELTWDAVTFDEYGVLIRTSSKTGKERTIRLTFSGPYFAQWKSDYPGIAEGKNPVFVTHRIYKAGGGDHILLEKDAITRLIRNLRQKTGIQKLQPSIFRPSRITHDVEDGYDSSYLMLKNWGTLRTPMLQVYAKPGEDYITRYALEKAGIKTPAKTRERSKALDPITCPRCSTLNPPGKKFCGQCGLSLTEDAKAQVDNISQQLHSLFAENPKAQPLFTQLLKELKPNSQ